MNENEAKQNFLRKFCETANIAEALSFVNCEMIHLMSWVKSDPTFDSKYREFKAVVTASLRDELYITALRRAKEVLSEPQTETTITIERDYKLIRQNEMDEGEYIEVGKTVTQKTRNLPIPQWAIKVALDNGGFIKAVESLMAEGVLSADQYKRILSVADQTTDRLKQVISGKVDGEEQLTERNALALLQQVVRGALD